MQTVRPKLAQVEGLGSQMGQGMLCGESRFESGLGFGSMTAERGSGRGGGVPGAGCRWEKGCEQWVGPTVRLPSQHKPLLGIQSSEGTNGSGWQELA